MGQRRAGGAGAGSHHFARDAACVLLNMILYWTGKILSLIHIWPPVPATAFEAPGVSLFAVGSVNGEGLQTVERRDDEAGVYRKLALRDGRLVGVLMLGRPAGGAAAVAAVERGAALDEALPLLQQQGEKM